MAGDKNKAFDEAYAKLNPEQKRAVDQIDGPVMVVAGPGTGKTQLLSVRAGNILRKDPTMLASNILCLTFTDAAAANMRDRLIKLIGQDAYKVAIHTFNSFGKWIMSTYPEYFFEWRETATADELTTYRIIEEILEKLPGNHVLAAQAFDGTFFAVKQLQNFINDCKRNNLSPNELKKVLQANQAVYEKLTPIISQHWPKVMRGKDAISKIHVCTGKLRKIKTEKIQVQEVASIGELILYELNAASTESADLPVASQSKPFTAWKNNWLELDEKKQFCFKAAKHHEKLLAAADVYEKYQKKLKDSGLADFNDQIMTVLKVLEANDVLRWNLQERFQYVMIDEYQDTNRAQLQMARSVTDAPVHEGQPNILVVGDDDQAIYRFQGADMANIHEFERAYRDPAIITLKDNYRSTKSVMTYARQISTQIELSLEKQMGFDKNPNIKVAQNGFGTELHVFEFDNKHYGWIASEINKTLKNASQSVAVLARERAQLDALVPYLRSRNVAMDYERRENVLDQEHVVALLTMARVVYAMQRKNFDDANAQLPEILSHPMWGIEPSEIWKIARQASAENKYWLDVIFEQSNTKSKNAADFLFGLSQQANRVPLEHMLDALIGMTEFAGTESENEDETLDKPVRLTGEISSPFKRYYFGDELLDKHPALYLTLLSHLACLRRHLRDHQNGKTERLTLKDLIDFVDAYQRAGLIMLDTAAHREDDVAVKLMTAHKAKGLEFDTVFVIGLNNDVWDKSKGSYSRFSYPQNLNQIKPSENVADDGLRLLYVAMTRAKQTLHLCYFKNSEDGREHQPYAPLLSIETEPVESQVDIGPSAVAVQYENLWLGRHLSVDHASKHALLADKLANFHISATGLNNFLDISRGGPSYFLTQNLLQFPAASSANAMYGNVVHETLQDAHNSIIDSRTPEIEQVLDNFETKLRQQPLTGHDMEQFVHRGRQALRIYLNQSLNSFSASQRVELNFRNQGIVLGKSRLSGKIDLIDFDDTAKSIRISDYKTGKAYSKWDVPSSAEEYERIKLHHYRYQLLFYKLLIDGSTDWGDKGWTAENGVLRFVEPDYYGKIRTLQLDYNTAELESLKLLINAVWQKIMKLDFPVVSEKYDPTLDGIIKFEHDLVDGRI